MKFSSFLLLISCHSLLAQNQNHFDYIKANSNSFNITDIQIKFPGTIHDQDIVLFGFIHGSATPQLVDFELLKYFVQHGRRYYAPEVTPSMAFFLNQYLSSGQEEILDFVIYFYKMRVPQDASVQFREKWQKIYHLNQTLASNEKIIVLGTDIPLNDKRLAITHLAYLLTEEVTGNPMIDSLRLYRNFEIDDLLIWSGKPVFDKAVAAKKPIYDFVYPLESRYHFAKRFFEYFLQKEQTQLLELFKENRKKAEEILKVDLKEREQFITESISQLVVPLLEKNEKVYVNYGYAHIHQARINDRLYLAGRLKQSYPEWKIQSILGLLAKSKAFKNDRLVKTGNTISERGAEFQEAGRSGYKSARSYDGHSLFERVKGVKWLTQAAKNKDILMLDLNQEGSPFHQNDYLVAYSRGGKGWIPEFGKSTTDYFQYVIFMQYSKSNTPITSSVLGLAK